MPRTKKKQSIYRTLVTLPPLSPDTYEGLRLSIALSGVLVPILVWVKGKIKYIIDGSHRKKIATQLGYECPEIIRTDLTEEEARAMARALNLARRQLNTTEKRQIIADQLGETPEKSDRLIGKMLGVSHPTVASVRAELEHGGKIFHHPTREGSDGVLQPASKFVFNGGSPWANPRSNIIATPPGVCRFLHDVIAPRYTVKTILDPCSGSGALTKPWRGRKVVAYEILNGKDFFRCPSRISANLVLCNPPFNSDNGESRFLPQVFLERIVKVVPSSTPIVLFAPMAMRLDQATRSSRWRWLRDHCPPITSIISLPTDAFGSVKVHSEILLFNMSKLKSHYFLPDKNLSK
jgi:hypothetical protein